MGFIAQFSRSVSWRSAPHLRPPAGTRPCPSASLRYGTSESDPHPLGFQRFGFHSRIPTSAPVVLSRVNHSARTPILLNRVRQLETRSNVGCPAAPELVMRWSY